MNLNEQIQYFAERPPSHLTCFKLAGSPELGLGPGGHGEDIAIGFRLKCACGAQDFYLRGYEIQTPDSTDRAISNPITAICGNCGTDRVLFDQMKHGYEAIACGTDYIADLRNEPNAKQVDIASGNRGTLDAIVYYPDDLFDEQFAEFEKRRQDLFTWLRVVFNEQSNNLKLDFECA